MRRRQSLLLCVRVPCTCALRVRVWLHGNAPSNHAGMGPCPFGRGSPGRCLSAPAFATFPTITEARITSGGVAVDGLPLLVEVPVLGVFRMV